MKTTHMTKLFGVEIELEIDLAPAEPEVGIMGAYVYDWSVASVNGVADKELCLEVEQTILEEYGEDNFVELLYDEGVGTDD